jgi:hypothetical protein
MASRVLLLAFLGTVMGAACGDEPIPAVPSFEVDVKPITHARCVRCHGAGGTLNGDPRTAIPTGPANGFFDNFEDQGDCTVPALAVPPLCRRGAKFDRATIRLYIHATNVDRMPLAPSDPLTDRELEILDRWTDPMIDPQP